MFPIVMQQLNQNKLQLLLGVEDTGLFLFSSFFVLLFSFVFQQLCLLQQVRAQITIPSQSIGDSLRGDRGGLEPLVVF